MAIFDPLLKALGFLLSLFYALPPHNLGVAIILLTFAIMLALYPLTAKQARSMIAMQMVQPEIKRIQAKYKNDKTKLNEEMMKFYQENKINPLAGCLPLVVQMPIFFALFRVLRNSYEYVPTSSKLYTFLCTNASGVTVNVDQCGKSPKLPNPTYFLGLNLSLSAPDQLSTWAKILGFALVIAVMFTGYMQSRQAQKRTPAINKQMAMVTKVLPIFFGFISLRFPAGLVLYFFVSNLWRLGQQEVIFRRFGTAAAPKHKSLQGPTKTAVIDVESRELEEGEADAAPPAKAKPSGKAGATPTKATPAKGTTPAKSGKGNGAAGGKPVVGPTPAGGGLRGLFRPPPPPSGTPTPRSSSKPAAKPAPSKKPSSPSSSTSTSRPGEAGRRTSKKKKKR
ncbi:MAG: YidC/Oxa1 family membrane protein insertase [Acidimicrobiia bacterium]|jgi:YidC/Oxa1 family membrane protein insertase